MILTQTDIKRQDLRTSDPDDYNLELGQAWEEILAVALRAKGFKAYRPKQLFMSPQKAVKVSKFKLRGKHELADRRAKEWFDKALLRPFQLDLIVKLGKLRLNVEVKALQPEAFRQHHIHIGLCNKYNLKRVKVDAIVLINQETGEAWTIPCECVDGEWLHWVRKKAIRGSGIDYAIHGSQLTPLEAWIDVVKDIYGLSQKTVPSI